VIGFQVPAILFFSFFSLVVLILSLAGPEDAKNLAEENVLRLIQIRFISDMKQFQEVAMESMGP
jgi:hypothetical protein